jgi:hypothetical protein
MLKMGRVHLAFEMRSYGFVAFGTPKADPPFIDFEFRGIDELV